MRKIARKITTNKINHLLEKHFFDSLQLLAFVTTDPCNYSIVDKYRNFNHTIFCVFFNVFIHSSLEVSFFQKVKM